MKPWKFRPDWQPPGSPDEEDWTDNWLSNSLAWTSTKVAPSWCKKENHWSGKLSDYLWTLCPCCLLLRGAALGFAAGVFVTLTLTFAALI